MNIAVHEKKGFKIITLEGEFDLYNIKALKDTIFNCIADTAYNTVIDLGGVHYMDSNAIGVLYAAQNKLADFNKELYISRMTPELAEVMRIVGLAFREIDLEAEK